MADELKTIDSYPDISFIDNITVDDLEDQMIEWYKEKKSELLEAAGEANTTVTLASGDERRLILSTCAYFLYQGYKYIDNAGKMGLLKYSTGDYLENLGALKGIYRKEATGATTTIRFLMTDTRTSATPIPEGTRLTAGDQVYFATDEYAEIAIGDLYVDVGATCTTTGEATNDYDIGDISTIVDPVAYIDSAYNITEPENGTDIETDEDLRYRIYAAPTTYSTTGSVAAYKALCYEYSSSIADVYVDSPEAGTVRIVYILEDGEIPGEESMDGLLEYLSDDSRKALTDNIIVEAPEAVSYDIDITYYINSSDSSNAETIQAAVEDAVESYESWQCAKLGRDINPNYLTYLVMQAGAKWVDIESPERTVLDDDQIAAAGTVTVTYGGLDDD